LIYLDQFVEDNVLLKNHQGDQAEYCVDQLMATYHRLESIIWQREKSTSKRSMRIHRMNIRTCCCEDKRRQQTRDTQYCVHWACRPYPTTWSQCDPRCRSSNSVWPRVQRVYRWIGKPSKSIVWSRWVWPQTVAGGQRWAADKNAS